MTQFGTRKKRKRMVWLCCFCMLFLAAGCGSSGQEEKESEISGILQPGPGAYDSTDTAIITGFDAQEKLITLKNLETGKQYTLSFDGGSCFFDPYGAQMAYSQTEPGSVVNLTFLKSRKKLNTMQITSDSWKLENVTNYTVQEDRHQLEIGTTLYALPEDVVLLSEGKQISWMDLHPIDALTIRGTESQVQSIVVERGHGYVRLTGDEYFLDGWVEVGNTVIQRVTENMLLVVPEGKHQLIISNKGTSGTRDITVYRDRELEVDVSDLKGAEPSYGTVIFTISPEEAELYIDGDKTDYSVPVKLEYGIHQMILMAEGYDTLSQYIKVGQESAGIEASMTPLSENGDAMELNPSQETEAADGAPEGNSVGNTGNAAAGNAADTAGNAADTKKDDSAKAGSATSTTSYSVTIEKPAKVEVYLDGNYVGVTPCEFPKEAGTHTLTLRKTGCTSKSYLITIDAAKKNVTYSFLDLIPLED